APTAIAAGDGAIWALEGSTGELVRIDVSSLAKQPIHVGGAPAGVSVGDGAVWLTTGPS
ncbi:MAG TPA: virginiamycin B lyase, partial [Actinobacteria bacterium]|nr:virginiamycin B lyase [Actinomycetota bacterium]